MPSSEFTTGQNHAQSGLETLANIVVRSQQLDNLAHGLGVECLYIHRHPDNRFSNQDLDALRWLELSAFPGTHMGIVVAPEKKWDEIKKDLLPLCKDKFVEICQHLAANLNALATVFYQDGGGIGRVNFFKDECPMVVDERAEIPVSVALNVASTPLGRLAIETCQSLYSDVSNARMILTPLPVDFPEPPGHIGHALRQIKKNDLSEFAQALQAPRPLDMSSPGLTPSDALAFASPEIYSAYGKIKNRLESFWSLALDAENHFASKFVSNARPSLSFGLPEHDVRVAYYHQQAHNQKAM